MNECYPLYGLVICGCCQAPLGFGFGISQHVNCPKCFSINRVPLEPVKSYESIGDPPQRTQPRGGAREEERELEGGNRMGGFEAEDLEYVGFEKEKRE
jgi:hypothetical protein